MKYTPGPWRQSNNELGYENFDILADGGTGVPNTGIATVVDPRFSDFRMGTVALDRDTCDANARLIAAAPDLLEALIDLMEQVDVLIENTPELDPIPFKLTIVVAARAAIAKATGKS